MRMRWGSYLELWIGAQHLSARFAHRRWLRPDMFDNAVSVSLDEDDDLSDAVLRLTAMLDANLLRSTAAIRVIVSDAHCRYLLLARPAGTRNRAELQASIHARFQASFGETLADWVLQADSAPAARHDLVCAMRRSLLDSLHQSADRLGKRLLSVQPLWLWCAGQGDAARHRGADIWLLAAGTQRVTAGLFRAGRCIGLRSSRPMSPGENVEHILTREMALYDTAEEAAQVMLFAPALTPGAAASVAGVPLTHRQLPVSWGERA